MNTLRISLLWLFCCNALLFIASMILSHFILFLPYSSWGVSFLDIPTLFFGLFSFLFWSESFLEISDIFWWYAGGTLLVTGVFLLYWYYSLIIVA